MSKIIFIAGLALIAATVFLVHSQTATPLAATHEALASDWDSWKTTFGKVYGHEENYRFAVYVKNRKFIEENQGVEYTLGETEFMDMTPEEFQATYLGLINADKPKTGEQFVAEGDVPASVDWRTKKAVSAIKNQGQCGSCWAFSTTGSLESEDAIHGSGLGDFSEQQLVDCSQKYGNQGCNGGLMDDAFQYVIDNGIDTESDYPYQGVDQTCKKQGGAFKITKFTDVAKGDCDGLQAAVAQQPVSVAVDAVTWQFYIGGVFPSVLCGKQLDHGVLAVGYNQKSQWIVKNSWGPMWGQKGFITLAKGNTCGICNSASFPSI